MNAKDAGLVVALRSMHVQAAGLFPPMCNWCAQSWPCPVVLLIGVIDAIEKEQDAAEGIARAFREAHEDE